MEKIATPLISVADILSLLSDPQVTVVDARGGPGGYERYMAGHLRGGIFMDLETQLSARAPDASKGGRHPLPDPATFGVLLGKAGITPLTHVLVYDDKAGANAAARFWWMMRAIGHTRVQVIDGGLTAIQEEGLPLEKGPSPLMRQDGPYPVEGWLLPTADMQTVDQARSADDSLVIDVREGYRYRGESEPIDLVAGHIPGAISVPTAGNVGADGRFLSADDIRKRFADNGISDDDEVVAYCGSGVNAAHEIAALEIAGIRAALFPGSWSQWSSDSDRPAATGPE